VVLTLKATFSLLGLCSLRVSARSEVNGPVKLVNGADLRADLEGVHRTPETELGGFQIHCSLSAGDVARWQWCIVPDMVAGAAGRHSMGCWYAKLLGGGTSLKQVIANRADARPPYCRCLARRMCSLLPRIWTDVELKAVDTEQRADLIRGGYCEGCRRGVWWCWGE
jgi:hypothetical protein